jgi:hypothetical protein
MLALFNNLRVTAGYLHQDRNCAYFNPWIFTLALPTKKTYPSLRGQQQVAIPDDNFSQSEQKKSGKNA